MPAKHPQRLSLTTSMVIPCHSFHATNLLILLSDFENHSSVKPDEIIVSLSGINNIPDELMFELDAFAQKLNVIFVTSGEDLSEATNRNRACFAAKGDIIISQDADDIFHMFRIEIIKYFFETYDIVHLLHTICGPREFNLQIPFDNMGRVSFNQIKYLTYLDSGKIFDHNINVGNGPASFLKTIYHQNPYNEALQTSSDVRFNEEVYKIVSSREKTIILLCDLYCYNWDLSAYRRKTTI